MLMKNTFIIIALLLVAYLFISPHIFSQPLRDSAVSVGAAPKEEIQANQPPKQKVSTGRDGFLTDVEFDLSMSVLLFGILVLCMEVYLIKIKQIGHDYIAKIILVTLIVTGTLFLITAGYNNDQIAPATGLLGTIAGYLLGKTSAPDNTHKPTKNEE
jgi:hypothetical protein